MANRAEVTVFNTSGGKEGSTTIPDVFRCPLRRDLVQFVHTNMRKNSRQAYGVQNHFGPMGIVAGHQHSAHSWGTGRAVSRIPRVSGGGTHRAGQGAFGNMCRSGRMFAPTKTYRRWHRKINKTQKRQALASCLAATACAPLVEARGHKIAEETKEIPLVVSDDIEKITKTKDAVECLENLGLSEELTKCQRKQTRPGKGKMRGRRYKRRRGPLIVYKNDDGCVKAFRNIPGVDLMNVESLNLLMLAPGGHVGRLCVWSKSAFESLEGRYSGKDLPKTLMKNDLNSLINSDEIQQAINAKKSIKKVPRKRNLLSSKKSRFETFRGFSLEEVASRKRKAESMDGKARKKFRQA